MPKATVQVVAVQVRPIWLGKEKSTWELELIKEGSSEFQQAYVVSLLQGNCWTGPYTGCVSNEATIDYVGPMKQTVLDNALLLEAIAGVDGVDDRQRGGTLFRDQVPNYSQILLETKDAGVKGLRIGILKEGLSSKIMDPAVEAKFRAAVAVFEELGATVEEVSAPMHTIAPALVPLASRVEQFGEQVARRAVDRLCSQICTKSCFHGHRSRQRRYVEV